MHGMSFNKLLEVIFKGSAILFNKNQETSMSKDGDKVLTLALKSVSVVLLDMYCFSDQYWGRGRNSVDFKLRLYRSKVLSYVIIAKQ